MMAGRRVCLLLLCVLLLAVAGSPYRIYAQEPLTGGTERGADETVLEVPQDVAPDGDGKVCTIVDGKEGTCYASLSEMDAALGQEEFADCRGQSTRWLYLYDGFNRSGRRLQFNDVGFWQDLQPWGFRNKTSSVLNQTRCQALLRDYSASYYLIVQPGQGYNMGVFYGHNWNNAVDAIYIRP